MNFYDSQEKTESPTLFKIQQAQQKGFKNYSYELHVFLIFLLGVTILYIYKKKILSFFLRMMSYHFIFNHSIIYNNNYISIILLHELHKVFFFLCIFFMLALFLIISVIFCLNGFYLYFIPLHLHWSKINIINGINNIFSYNSFIESIQMFIKILIFFLILCIYSFYYVYKIKYFFTFSPMLTFKFTFHMMMLFIFLLCIGFIPCIILNIIWKNFIYYKNLRMSIQEIKDEYKFMEGNFTMQKKSYYENKFIYKKKNIKKTYLANKINTNKYCNIQNKFK
ncbi:Flagellar biosynthetic protein FlhB [Buchnera aphidicola (Pterocallis alni)]|uniref:EscU/YscU/HrcU family type III secretion system export apparatus switch protein n=1 Tax=Buchnera aphidicola TaxID=9 RepID=UPI003463A094